MTAAPRRALPPRQSPGREGWRRVLAQLVASGDAAADRARRRLRRGRPTRRALLVVPYIGFGTEHRLCLNGRVLEDPGFAEASPSASGWANLVQLRKRLASAEVPGARVRARLADAEHVVTTDDEGYFSIEIEPTQPLAHGWHTVQLDLADAESAAATPAGVEATALVPPATARFGIISDIDDTVVQTHVRNRLKMLLALARSNAHTRKPFHGVAALYRALHRGAGGDEGNPLFYVSSSPWNLYTPLVEFLERAGHSARAAAVARLRRPHVVRLERPPRAQARGDRTHLRDLSDGCSSC